MKARFGRDIYCQVCGKDDKITVDGTWKLDGTSRKFGYKYRCNRCSVTVREIDQGTKLEKILEVRAMAEVIWAEKPDFRENRYWVGVHFGEFSRKFAQRKFDRDEAAWLEKLKTHYEAIEKQAETLRFLFGDEGVKTANLEKIQIWREKADLWDQYAIYDNDKEEEILVKDLITAYEKLEAAKTILYDVCDYYGTDSCQEGVCDCDPNGWEGCVTQKILNILEAEG